MSSKLSDSDKTTVIADTTYYSSTPASGILTEDNLLHTILIAVSRLNLGVADSNTVERHLREERENGKSFYIGVLHKIAGLHTDPFLHVSPGYLLYLRDNAKDHFRNELSADCHLREFSQCITSTLDYLTSRSMLFRRSLASRLSFRSVAASIELAIPSEWVNIYNPPDVRALLLLLQWLYLGSTEGIEAAVGDGLVGIHNILMTIAFLDLTIDEPDAMAMTQALQAGVLQLRS
ncbi:hypothetical protein R3P38DRAFT_2934740 [Favolaschia claudopus]|uniref:Uncharacterized protein n=1 Tax=Favolaschia claudopus TaxID=2862362 RepID=A0AAW0BTA7_9AGAR